MELFLLPYFGLIHQLKWHIKLSQGVSLLSVCVGQKVLSFVTLLCCESIQTSVAKKTEVVLFFLGHCIFFFMRVSILLPGIDQHWHTAHVRGYSGAGLDKRDCAGIPFEPYMGEREELRRDAPPICWPSCQTRRNFLQSWGLLLFYVWISGVLWLCVRERMKRREPEKRWIKGGNREFLSGGSEVYSVINTHKTKYTEIPCSVSFWVHDSWEIWLLGNWRHRVSAGWQWIVNSIK